MSKNYTQEKRVRRHKRIRARVSGIAARPRLAVFRSNKFIYAQLIDDVSATTIAAANDMDAKGTKTERATAIGNEIAKIAKSKNITSIVFDRGGFRFTGRVKALADAARAGGLQF